ncbi:hypothetical protein CH25_gp22 [Mycobacterium phage EagleEye]|uniref:Uncharacterized protein n=1 Tax=Mycobacterium phage EagleEye TaxID=1429759 RepID=W0LMU0_9CAUD|nr:hypothetical protein CH25_gp22 [Mycobacterium phage EagleEye]AHG23864.1 hypothetical protein PBI_EAGLEEYE_84 [Mycobacterium phage EagleEye]QDK03517.1 hypothetical protein SEA_LUCYEDI_83 [Mycobacterium phage Lucyedi]QNJ55862.1 hypothetical protein SEA_PAINTERBOY_83 [Mycobacterium phage PainterBoy]
MDTKTAKMQDKVAKLLRQAEDVAGTPEEAVFQAKAFELVSKYGIDMAQVEASKKGLDANVQPDAIRWEWTFEGKYVAQQVLLLHGIAQALHCKTVLTKLNLVYGGTTQRLIMFGVPRHIERVQFLWSILRPQMLRLVETVRPAEGFKARLTYDYRTGAVREKKTSGQLTKYRRAWIAGFSQAVGERLRAEEAKALENANEGALVLYRGDAQRAELALKEAFPRTSRQKQRTRYDMNGYSHGRRDGQAASMNHSLAS